MIESVCVLSGGLDSTVATALSIKGHGEDPDRVLAVSFDYGQRHRIELQHARAIANALGIRHHILDLSALRPVLAGSALTDDVDVPLGHYADESMRATVVPNRNMVMLSIATAVAVAEGAAEVVTGVHAGDHPIYPDCRPDFITAASLAARLGTEGHASPVFRIHAPFVFLTKAEIVAIGASIDAPLALTWSCYQGGDRHCGECGTCVERIEAFAEADVADPTDYVSGAQQESA